MSDAENTVSGRTGFSFPKAAPDGFIAAVLLSFLATAGLFYVNILGALVEGLVKGLSFSDETAGFVASANVYGAAIGAFIAVFSVKRLPWRRTAIVVLIALMTIDLISTQISNSNIMIPVRLFHGMVGGFLVGTGFSVIARTKSPDRTFGMLLFVQYGLGGVGLKFLPEMVPVYGVSVLFLALLAFSLVTLLMVPFIADYPPRKHSLQKIAPKAGIMWRPLSFVLVAIFLFQAANMGIAAYIFRLGESYGLVIDTMSNQLGLANWIAMSGAAVVYLVGIRYGRLFPMLAGLVVTAVGLALFHWSDNSSWFFVANIITGITWAFMMPYLFGMCAEFDAEGQMAALSGFFSKMGLASGPMLVALMVRSGDYSLIINMSIVGIILCLLAVFMPARLIDRQSNLSSITE